MKKTTLLALILILLLLTGCGTPTAAPTPAAPALELSWPGGARSFTLDELKALPAVEGWAGIKSSTGEITPPAKYRGILLKTLVEQAGGMPADGNLGLSLVARDGYAMTMSYAQALEGDFIAYDPATGDEKQPGSPLQAILAYESNGQPLPETSEGPLRIMVISEKNDQVIDGHWAVKWINQIELKSLAAEWTIDMSGAIQDTLDRGSFESCAAPGCHGASWTDEKAQIWSGVPLYRLVGRIDDEIKHDTGAFNRELAARGYSISIIAQDGYSVTLTSDRIQDNPRILLAHAVNENPLDEKDFPLRLVGADLQKNEQVGQIARIELRLPTADAPAATPTLLPTPTAAAAPAGTGAAALSIQGTVELPLELTLETLQGMEQVTLTTEHPKKGQQTYTGVKLNALLERAGVKSAATTVILKASDGYTAQISLADLRKCADCMLAIDADGKLNAVMPGQQSNLWVKDITGLEIQ